MSNADDIRPFLVAIIELELQNQHDDAYDARLRFEQDAVSMMDALVDSLDDPDFRVRALVAEILGSTGETYPMDAMRTRLRRERRDEVIHTIRSSLALLGDEDQIASLALQLKSHKTAERVMAAEMLGKGGDPTIIPYLLSALKDHKPQVRINSAQALARMDEPGTIPHLIEALNDPKPSVRDAVVSALGQMNARAAVGPLIDLVRAGEISVDVVRALDEIGDPQAAPALVHIWQDAEVDHDIQGMARDALVRMAAYEPILHLLQSDDDNTRRQAAVILGKIGNRNAIRHLEPLLDDTHEQVRRWTRWALKQIDEPTEIPPRDMDMIDILLETLNDSDPQMQLQAIQALGKARTPRAVEALCHALEYAYYGELRSAAARALGLIGDSRAAPSLRAALHDAHEKVRQTSKWALGHLNDD